MQSRRESKREKQGKVELEMRKTMQNLWFFCYFAFAE
jgi:hypothetical protein